MDWETRDADCKTITDECDSCERGEQVRRNPAVIPGKRSNWRVNDEWSIDLVTELPKTTRKFMHLLVAVEAVSGFPEAYPLRNRSAKEVASCLVDLMFRFGIPRRVRCDQGSEFEGEVLRLCERFGVHLIVISSHRPQANGQVERMNQTVVDRLTRAATDDWDLDIFSALHGIRCTPSRRTGLSPHEVMFGEPPRIHREFTEDDLKEGQEREDILKLAAEQRYVRHKDLVRLVREHLWKYEDERTPLEIGGLVWVRNFARKKFQPKWLGPSVIVEKHAHSLKVKGENGQARVVNRGDVKPYHRPQMDHAAGEDDVELIAA